MLYHFPDYHTFETFNNYTRHIKNYDQEYRYICTIYTEREKERDLIVQESKKTK